MKRIHQFLDWLSYRIALRNKMIYARKMCEVKFWHIYYGRNREAAEMQPQIDKAIEEYVRMTRK